MKLQATNKQQDPQINNFDKDFDNHLNII